MTNLIKNQIINTDFEFSASREVIKRVTHGAINLRFCIELEGTKEDYIQNAKPKVT